MFCRNRHLKSSESLIIIDFDAFFHQGPKNEKTQTTPQTLKKYRQPHFTQRFQGVGGGVCGQSAPDPGNEKTMTSAGDRVYSRGSSGAPVIAVAARKSWKYKGLRRFGGQIRAWKPPGSRENGLAAAQIRAFLWRSGHFQKLQRQCPPPTPGNLLARRAISFSLAARQ